MQTRRALTVLALLALTATPATAATPLVGGDSLVVGGKRCVIGFNASGPTIITSGACAGGTAPVGVITPPASGTPTASVRAGAVLLTVRGSTEAPIGTQVCLSSPTGGWRCGTVAAKNQTINLGGGVISGLTRATICPSAGDNGAPVITPSGQAQGVVVGGSGSCATGGTTYFMPINRVLATHGITLRTGH